MPAADDPDDFGDPTRAAKAAVRARCAAARGARTADELRAARAAITAHVLGRAAAHRWRRVAAYEPLGTEPGSRELLSGLVGLEVEVLVPVTLPDRDLDWRPVAATGGGFGGGAFGAVLGRDAIAGVDCVLAPAFAVARDGTRLGRGGGSYDRALARLPGSAVVAALLFDDELADVLPRDPWDVAVDAVVQPSGWHDLGADASEQRRNTGRRPPG